LRLRRLGLIGRRHILFLLLCLQLLLARLFLRDGKEILPPKQHQRGQHDGKNGVLVIGH
jgi:hypothetical protein